MKKIAFLVAAMILVGGIGAGLILHNPAKTCDSPEVERLTLQVLKEQLKVEGDISLQNIIKKFGGFFDRRYVCEADITGVKKTGEADAGQINHVRYTSDVTLDTHRVRVGAQIIPQNVD